MSEQIIQLLATDFDGTVFHHGGDSGLYPALAERLKELRTACNLRWLVCTGRSLASLRNATVSMNRAGIYPDYVLVRHRWLFAHWEGIWYPHIPLILSFLAASLRHQSDVSMGMSALGARIRSELYRARAARSPSGHFRAQIRSEEDCAKAHAFAEEILSGIPGLRMARYSGELDVIVLPTDKAIAAQTVASHLGLEKEGILAIGDARADVVMLSDDVSGMTGCPSNARPETVGTVLERGGHISRAPALEGVIDIIRAYAEGDVDSSPPADWQPKMAVIDMSHGATPGSDSPLRQRQEVFLVVTALVVGVLVLCSFNIIPYGQVILKPITKLFHFFVDLFN